MMDAEKIEALRDLLETWGFMQDRQSSAWFLAALLLIEVRQSLVQQQLREAAYKD